jgi:Tfp pilus assembly protein PilF
VNVAQGQIATARDEMTSLLKEFPDSSPVHAMNGLLKSRSKDLPGAKAEYQRALQLDRNFCQDPLSGRAL